MSPIFGAPDVQQLQAKRDIAGLIKALSYQKELSVRCRAAEALGALRAKEAVEQLIAATKDADVNVRKRAAIALGEIGDSRATIPLVSLLIETDKGMEIAAIEALVKIGAPAVSQVIAGLQNPDDHTRACAAVILGRIGDPRAVTPLLSALRKNNVRNTVSALVKIGGPAVDGLLAALREDCAAGEQKRIGSYVGGLTQIGAPAVDPLIAALRDKDAWVRMLAAGMLGLIDKSLLDAALQVRISVSLQAALQDQNEEVRTAAERALANTGGMSLNPPE